MKKHSKFKNTGLLFELLIRQISTELLSDNDPKANHIIKEFFSGNTELHKELELYKTIITNKFKDGNDASMFLTEVLKSYRSFDKQKLKEERYKLVKLINETYQKSEFYKYRVPQYAIYASVCQLFENETGVASKPDEIVKCRSTLIEHIKAPQRGKNLNEIEDRIKHLDEGTRILANKFIIDRFNNKYKDLNENQKRVLGVFIKEINNIESLKSFLTEESTKITTELNNQIKLVTDSKTKIKLTEVSKNVSQLILGNIIENKHIYNALKLYHLIENVHETINFK